jgi:hypothetical protein
VCVVEVDVDTPTGGFWRFSLAGDRLHSIATYVDPQNHLRQREWILDCNPT